MNVLKSHLKQSVLTMLSRGGSQREIVRVLGVDPKTTHRIARELSNSLGVATDPVIRVDANTPTLATDVEEVSASNSLGVATGADATEGVKSPGWPPVHPRSLSACEAHREWIEEQVGLGRHAMSIYRELVDRHGFGNQYNSVKRFVSSLKHKDPERFDVLEFAPGEEAQVDYGQGALLQALSKRSVSRWPTDLPGRGERKARPTFLKTYCLAAEFHGEINHRHSEHGHGTG